MEEAGGSDIEQFSVRKTGPATAGLQDGRGHEPRMQAAARSRETDPALELPERSECSSADSLILGQWDLFWRSVLQTCKPLGSHSLQPHRNPMQGASESSLRCVPSGFLSILLGCFSGFVSGGFRAFGLTVPCLLF